HMSAKEKSSTQSCLWHFGFPVERQLKHAAKPLPAHPVIPVAEFRIPVHQRPRIKRMTQTPHFMFERKTRHAALDIDDLGKPILMRLFTISQSARCKTRIRL